MKKGQLNAKGLEDALFANYMEFFRLAEERRRWNLWKDIPWKDVNPETGEDIATVVEAFSSVEMFLPDYTAKILQMVRKSRGRAWFQANWGYEESKHSLTLAHWLVLSGHRSEDGMRAYENALLDNSEWELPFDHPRQMIIYTMIQEKATMLNYQNLRGVVVERNDGALSNALQKIAADEGTHYHFFRKGVKLFRDFEHVETLDDLKFVFANFSMPAQSLIPGWDDHAKIIHQLGIYGPKEYLKNVYRPILSDMRLAPDELRYIGAPKSLIVESEEREAEEREKAKAVFVSLP